MSPPAAAANDARDTLAGAPLGRATAYPDRYAPEVLFAVPRAQARAALDLGAALPFAGGDQWTAYELTWLDPRGRPRIAIATIVVPANTPAIVESKSMKLYLGSFAQTAWRDDGAVTAAIVNDLGQVAGARVEVTLADPARFAAEGMRELPGDCLDSIEVDCDRYDVDPSLLAVHGGEAAETLVTRLFRAVCPVTGQPDLASVQLTYRGPRIDRAGLLRYLVSYRRHAGFHEHCVERIFVDVIRACRCTALTVYARFTRRGGIEINPFRSNAGLPLPPNVRTPRQ